MNRIALWELINNLLNNWNGDHALCLAAGMFMAFGVIVPVWLVIRRLIRGQRRSYYDLEAIIKKGQAQAKTQRSRVQELQEEKDALKRKCKLLTTKRKWWEKSSATQEKALELSKSKYEQIVREHKEFVRIYNELALRFNALASTVRVEPTIHAANEPANEIAGEVEKRTKSLAASNEALMLENQAVQKQLAEKIQQLGLLSIKLNEQTAELEARGQQIETMRNAKEELLRRTQTVEQDKDSLGKLLAEKQQELDQSSTEFRQKSQALVVECEGHRTRGLALQQELNEVTLRNQTLAGENKRLVDQNQDLQTRDCLHQEEAERLEQAVHTLTDRRDELQQRQQGLDLQISELGNKILTLEQQAENYSQEKVEFEQRIHLLDGSLRAALVGLIPTNSPSKSVEVWNEIQPVNIGLDFGTHSTKVVVRVKRENPRVLFLDEQTPGYPSFAAPSLVRLKDGRLFFGKRAAEENGGQLFSSLKMALLPGGPSNGETHVNFPPGISAKLLVAIYLAWVLGRIKDVLGREGRQEDALNIAAPMDHVENTELKDRYLHVVHASWLATFGPHSIRIDQGIEICRVEPLFKYWLGQDVPVKEKRPFEVLAETLAPLVSLALAPTAQEGIYMMVDMGAGTTEISMNKILLRDSEYQILCYHDVSIPLGANRFDKEDAKACLRAVEEEVEKELRNRMDLTWKTAFHKDLGDGPLMRKSYRQLAVLLSGGGLLRQNLQHAIKNSAPNEMRTKVGLNDAEISYEVRWHHPADLRMKDQFDFGASSPNDAFLVVAHGLSVERQKWPDPSLPGAIPISVPKIKADDPDDFWYHHSGG